MIDGIAIPLHLAVHLLGSAVAAGLVLLGWYQRDRIGPTWPGLVLGGALLMLAEMLSGALVVDSATFPLVLRAAGYAGVAVGAVGSFSPGSVAAVALVAPASVHVSVAIAGVAAAIASMRGRFEQSTGTWMLGAGLGAWAAADGLGRWVPNLAGTISVLGSVAVGSWIVLRVGSSLLARALAGATALVVVTAIVLSGAGGLLVAGGLEDDQLTSLQSVVEAQRTILTVDGPAELRGLASALSGSALAQQVNQVGDGSLDARAQGLAELPGVDVALIVSSSGAVVGSWDVLSLTTGPMAAADETTIAGNVVVQQGLLGESGGGTVTTGDGRVLAIGAAPITPIDADGTRRLDRIAGTLVLGRDISAASLVSRVGEQTDAEVVLLQSGAVVATTDPNLQTPEAQRELLGLLGSASPAIGEVAGGSRYAAVAEFGTSADRGHLVLLRDDSAGGDLEGDATRTLFVASLLGLVLAGGLAVAGSSVLVQPVQQVTAAAERLALGDEEVSLPPPGPDEVGRLSAAFAAMLEAITDREQDLAEAADTEADLRRRLEIITGSLSEALLAVDEHGLVTRANPAARKLLGVDDPVGLPVTRVLTGTDETGRPVITALSSSEGRVVKATVGPGEVEVAATSAPLLDTRGRTLGRVHLLRDVTGEAQAERMKTEFLANISHELRTPLTPVRGYADVLSRRELPHETVADIAGRIGDAAKRLERVIGMLVDYAALEAGRLDITLAPTSVATSVEAALAELREADIEGRVTVEVDPQLPLVNVDAALFRRQLVELVDNAVKFSDDKVLITAQRARGRTVEVIVRDHGPGIPAEALGELSEGFRQGDGSATRRFGGLGLGLAMVRRIGDALGGDVRFEERETGGTDAVLVCRTAER